MYSGKSRYVTTRKQQPTFEVICIVTYNMNVKSFRSVCNELHWVLSYTWFLVSLKIDTFLCTKMDNFGFLLNITLKSFKFDSHFIVSTKMLKRRE